MNVWIRSGGGGGRHSDIHWQDDGSDAMADSQDDATRDCGPVGTMAFDNFWEHVCFFCRRVSPSVARRPGGLRSRDLDWRGVCSFANRINAIERRNSIFHFHVNPYRRGVLLPSPSWIGGTTETGGRSSHDLPLCWAKVQSWGVVFRNSKCLQMIVCLFRKRVRWRRWWRNGTETESKISSGTISPEV